MTKSARRMLPVLLAAVPMFAQQAPDNADAKLMSNHCGSNPALGSLTAKAWNGWGANISNTRWQPSAAAALPDPAKLKLKWAFGFPGAQAVYGQPTVVGGRVFVGVDSGYVYSLDAATGCVYWSFKTDAGVRSAASVGASSKSGQTLVYFGDLKGQVYALDARTGDQVWKVAADPHPQARVTGATQLYQGRLYVPVASLEEAAATDPAYECCTFRGSVVALDAQTGKQIWKTFIIADSPKKTGKNAKGTQLWAPSGGGVWNAPTIDPDRHALYIGTGDSYTQPAANTTDSIMAMNLDTGKILWYVQDTAHDAWVVSCVRDKDKENCPENAGPDYDFGSSPMLVKANGKTLLICAQKSGYVYAHDPDQKGKLVWKTANFSAPPPATGQIVWGGTADASSAYFGLNSGGVVALGLKDGERRWFSDIKPDAGRKAGHDAAISSVPGYVVSGGWDGVLRLLSTKDGKVVWSFDMAKEFDTVNGVKAKGGSMGSAGPTIAGGMIFAGAGYPGVQDGANGNVLLAFGE